MWFSEDPWPPIIIVGLIGAGLLMAGISSQRPKYLGFGAICGLLCVAIWFYEQNVVTDGERIEGHIFDLADAFHLNDEERMLSHFSLQDEFDRNMARAGMAMADIEGDYRITDMSVNVRAEGTLAESVFRANATVTVVGAGQLGYQPTRWRLHWRKEAGEWKIVEVDRLEVIGDDEMPPLSGRQ